MAPLERAARALCEAQGYAPSENEMARAVEEVRAVLEAVREPDDFMVRAGIIERHEAEVPEAWNKATVNIYTAMIDAALSE